MDRHTNRLHSGMLVALVLGILCVGIAPGFVVAADSSTNKGGGVWIVPVKGTIDVGLAEYVKRVVSDAESAGADLLLIEINTFGGRVDAATEVRDALIATEVPTVAFVSERAISAGALIALSVDQIIMAPGATLGAAEPRPLDEKTLSYVRAEFEATAERHGRDPQIAAAMVDSSVSIDGVTDPGQILTLSATQAYNIEFVDGIANNRSQALELAGITGAQIIEVGPTWAESLVRFLTDPIVSQILLVIGFLGLLAELTSPGWGVPGSIGLSSLALFFGSRLLVGLVGLEVLLLFVLGLVLLAIEVFVIPGFGAPGILGILAIGGSLFWSFPDPRAALQAMAITALAIVVMVLLFLKRFQGSSLWGRLILTKQQVDEEYRPNEPKTIDVGAIGYTLTPLRPAGRIKAGEEYYDVVSEGEMVPVGRKVRVVRVEAMRIVVRPVEED